MLNCGKQTEVAFLYKGYILKKTIADVLHVQKSVKILLECIVRTPFLQRNFLQKNCVLFMCIRRTPVHVKLLSARLAIY